MVIGENGTTKGAAVGLTGVAGPPIGHVLDPTLVLPSKAALGEALATALEFERQAAGFASKVNFGQPPHVSVVGSPNGDPGAWADTLANNASSTTKSLDTRGYSDFDSLLRGEFQQPIGQGETSLPPKPTVEWDVQTGHRALRPHDTARATSTASSFAPSVRRGRVKAGGASIAPSTVSPSRQISHGSAISMTSAATTMATSRSKKLDKAVRGARRDISSIPAWLINSAPTEMFTEPQVTLGEPGAWGEEGVVDFPSAPGEYNPPRRRKIVMVKKKADAVVEKVKVGDQMINTAKKIIQACEDVEGMIWEAAKEEDAANPEDSKAPRFLRYTEDELEDRKECKQQLQESIRKLQKVDLGQDLSRLARRLVMQARQATQMMDLSDAGHENDHGERIFKLQLNNSKMAANAALGLNKLGRFKLFAGFCRTLKKTKKRSKQSKSGRTSRTTSEVGDSDDETLQHRGASVDQMKRIKRLELLNMEMSEIKKEEDIDPESFKERIEGMLSFSPKNSERNGSIRRASSLRRQSDGKNDPFGSLRGKVSSDFLRLAELIETGQASIQRLLNQLQRLQRRQEDTAQDMRNMVKAEMEAEVDEMIKAGRVPREALEAAECHSPKSQIESEDTQQSPYRTVLRKKERLQAQLDKMLLDMETKAIEAASRAAGDKALKEAQLHSVDTMMAEALAEDAAERAERIAKRGLKEAALREQLMEQMRIKRDARSRSPVPHLGTLSAAELAAKHAALNELQSSGPAALDLSGLFQDLDVMKAARAVRRGDLKGGTIDTEGNILTKDGTLIGTIPGLKGNEIGTIDEEGNIVSRGKVIGNLGNTLQDIEERASQRSRAIFEQQEEQDFERQASGGKQTKATRSPHIGRNVSSTPGVDASVGGAAAAPAAQTFSTAEAKSMLQGLDRLRDETKNVSKEIQKMYGGPKRLPPEVAGRLQQTQAVVADLRELVGDVALGVSSGKETASAASQVEIVLKSMFNVPLSATSLPGTPEAMSPVPALPEFAHNTTSPDQTGRSIGKNVYAAQGFAGALPGEETDGPSARILQLQDELAIARAEAEEAERAFREAESSFGQEDAMVDTQGVHDAGRAGVHDSAHCEAESSPRAKAPSPGKSHEAATNAEVVKGDKKKTEKQEGAAKRRARRKEPSRGEFGDAPPALPDHDVDTKRTSLEVKKLQTAASRAQAVNRVAETAAKSAEKRIELDHAREKTATLAMLLEQSHQELEMEVEKAMELHDTAVRVGAKPPGQYACMTAKLHKLMKEKRIAGRSSPHSHPGEGGSRQTSDPVSLGGPSPRVSIDGERKPGVAKKRSKEGVPGAREGSGSKTGKKGSKDTGRRQSGDEAVEDPEARSQSREIVEKFGLDPESLASAKARFKAKVEIVKRLRALREQVKMKTKVLLTYIDKEEALNLLNAGVLPASVASALGAKPPTVHADSSNLVEKQNEHLQERAKNLGKAVNFWSNRVAMAAEAREEEERRQEEELQRRLSGEAASLEGEDDLLDRKVPGLPVVAAVGKRASVVSRNVDAESDGIQDGMIVGAGPGQQDQSQRTSRRPSYVGRGSCAGSQLDLADGQISAVGSGIGWDLPQAPNQNNLAVAVVNAMHRKASLNRADDMGVVGQNAGVDGQVPRVKASVTTIAGDSVSPRVKASVTTIAGDSVENLVSETDSLVERLLQMAKLPIRKDGQLQQLFLELDHEPRMQVYEQFESLFQQLPKMHSQSLKTLARGELPRTSVSRMAGGTQLPQGNTKMMKATSGMARRLLQLISNHTKRGPPAASTVPAGPGKQRLLVQQEHLHVFHGQGGDNSFGVGVPYRELVQMSRKDTLSSFGESSAPDDEADQRVDDIDKDSDGSYESSSSSATGAHLLKEDLPIRIPSSEKAQLRAAGKAAAAERARYLIGHNNVHQNKQPAEAHKVRAAAAAEDVVLPGVSPAEESRQQEEPQEEAIMFSEEQRLQKNYQKFERVMMVHREQVARAPVQRQISRAISNLTDEYSPMSSLHNSRKYCDGWGRQVTDSDDELQPLPYWARGVGMGKPRPRSAPELLMRKHMISAVGALQTRQFLRRPTRLPQWTEQLDMSWRAEAAAVRAQKEDLWRQYKRQQEREKAALEALQKSQSLLQKLFPAGGSSQAYHLMRRISAAMAEKVQLAVQSKEKAKKAKEEAAKKGPAEERPEKKRKRYQVMKLLGYKNSSRYTQMRRKLERDDVDARVDPLSARKRRTRAIDPATLAQDLNCHSLLGVRKGFDFVWDAQAGKTDASSNEGAAETAETALVVASSTPRAASTPDTESPTKPAARELEDVVGRAAKEQHDLVARKPRHRVRSLPPAAFLLGADHSPIIKDCEGPESEKFTTLQGTAAHLNRVLVQDDVFAQIPIQRPYVSTPLTVRALQAGEDQFAESIGFRVNADNKILNDQQGPELLELSSRMQRWRRDSSVTEHSWRRGARSQDKLPLVIRRRSRNRPRKPAKPSLPQLVQELQRTYEEQKTKNDELRRTDEMQNWHHEKKRKKRYELLVDRLFHRKQTDSVAEASQVAEALSAPEQGASRVVREKDKEKLQPRSRFDPQSADEQATSAPEVADVQLPSEFPLSRGKAHSPGADKKSPKEQARIEAWRQWTKTKSKAYELQTHREKVLDIDGQRPSAKEGTDKENMPDEASRPSVGTGGSSAGNITGPRNLGGTSGMPPPQVALRTPSTQKGLTPPRRDVAGDAVPPSDAVQASPAPTEVAERPPSKPKGSPRKAEDESVGHIRVRPKVEAEEPQLPVSRPQARLKASGAVVTGWRRAADFADQPQPSALDGSASKPVEFQAALEIAGEGSPSASAHRKNGTVDSKALPVHPVDQIQEHLKVGLMLFNRHKFTPPELRVAGGVEPLPLPLPRKLPLHPLGPAAEDSQRLRPQVARLLPVDHAQSKSATVVHSAPSAEASQPPPPQGVRLGECTAGVPAPQGPAPRERRPSKQMRLPQGALPPHLWPPPLPPVGGIHAVLAPLSLPRLPRMRSKDPPALAAQPLPTVGSTSLPAIGSVPGVMERTSEKKRSKRLESKKLAFADAIREDTSWSLTGVGLPSPSPDEDALARMPFKQFVLPVLPMKYQEVINRHQEKASRQQSDSLLHDGPALFSNGPGKAQLAKGDTPQQIAQMEEERKALERYMQSFSRNDLRMSHSGSKGASFSGRTSPEMYIGQHVDVAARRRRSRKMSSRFFKSRDKLAGSRQRKRSRSVSEVSGGASGEELEVANVYEAAPTEITSSAMVKKIKQRIQASSYNVDGVSLSRLWKSLDKDGSGELSSSELRRAFREKFKIKAQEVSDEQIDWLFKTLDKDGSGSIDAAELEAFASEAER